MDIKKKTENSDDLFRNARLKLSFYDWCISILSSKNMSDPNNLSRPLRKRNIFDRFHPWTSDVQISMRQKYWRFRLTFEIVKVRLSAVCKQSFLSHMPLTLYKTFAWQTFASLGLFTCLVYVSSYCVPIAHLRQNKPFPLLYLGHAQIITLSGFIMGWSANSKKNKGNCQDIHRPWTS